VVGADVPARLGRQGRRPPAGQDTYGRFMRIRTFDCWLHEQDIRDAVGKPGGEDGAAAALALDEMAGAAGYIVGKKAAPTVTLTMPAGVFARLGGGRVDPSTLRDQVAIDGDAELGERIVANMAYTI